MGTPDFLSPEQARNLHRADIRSDLYSLGCTFYYLLTGRVPFPGGSALEKLVRQAVEEPAPLEQLRPGIPAAVAAIVRRLMAKDPAARFQTPAELAEALAPLAGNGTVSWTDPQPITPASADSDAGFDAPAADGEPQASTLPPGLSPTLLSTAGVATVTRLPVPRVESQQQSKSTGLYTTGLVGGLLALLARACGFLRGR
jgi:serine/threonine-protein kinase